MKKHTDELMDWYLNGSAAPVAESPDPLQALRQVAQLVAWQNFGECRGYSYRLLTPHQALSNARAAIEKTANLHDSLMAIAAHHEEQRELWATDWTADDDDHTDYHRERRDFALRAIGMHPTEEEKASAAIAQTVEVAG